MSITDELREWAHGFNGPWKRNEEMLLAIADRIDAAHQKAEDEWKAKDGQSWLHGYSECHAELMEGNEAIAADLEKAGWIQLPKDADGVTIRIGDKMLLPNGKTRNVEAIGVETFVTWNPDNKYYAFYVPDMCHHIQSDSWERIIRDAQGDGILNQIDGRPSDFDALVERCKRLAGEDV